MDDGTRDFSTLVQIVTGIADLHPMVQDSNGDSGCYFCGMEPGYSYSFGDPKSRLDDDNVDKHLDGCEWAMARRWFLAQ